MTASPRVPPSQGRRLAKRIAIIVGVFVLFGFLGHIGGTRSATPTAAAPSTPHYPTMTYAPPTARVRPTPTPEVTPEPDPVAEHSDADIYVNAPDVDVPNIHRPKFCRHHWWC
jgi:hypothetical protein